MNKAVHDFVSACQVCQQAKPDRSKLPGLLQPLSVPDRAWRIISIDFIEGLPMSGSVNCILVVVDLFSKYAHFIGLKHPFTASSMAKLFFSNVFKLHGHCVGQRPHLHEQALAGTLQAGKSGPAHVYCLPPTVGWPDRMSQPVS